MKKKRLALLICLVLVVLAGIGIKNMLGTEPVDATETEPVTQAETEPSTQVETEPVTQAEADLKEVYAEVYAQFLNSTMKEFKMEESPYPGELDLTSDISLYMAFTDLNADGVPDMLLYQDAGATGIDVFTIEDENVVYMYSFAWGHLQDYKVKGKNQMIIMNNYGFATCGYERYTFKKKNIETSTILGYSSPDGYTFYVQGDDIMGEVELDASEFDPDAYMEPYLKDSILISEMSKDYYEVDTWTAELVESLFFDVD